jgi:hypothetical protein
LRSFIDPHTRPIRDDTRLPLAEVQASCFD